MPTYSYQCQSCNATFNYFLPITDHKKPCYEPCPYCKETKVIQIITSIQPIVDPAITGKYKVPSDFAEFLKKLKQKHPDSKTINTV